MIDIMALLFLFGLLQNNSLLDVYRRKVFLCGIILTIFVILLEAGTILADGGSARWGSLNAIINALGFAITPMIPIVLINVFNSEKFKIHILLLIPTVLNTFIALLSPFFGWIFYINSNNYYQRGSMFFVFVIVYIANIIFLLAYILHLYKKSLYPMKWKVISLAVFILLGTCIQIFVPSFQISWHGVTISLFLLYILLTEFDASFDMLTGLYNRATFMETSRQLTGKETFAVVAMDINEFKKVNDTYGHEYGDTVLREVASIIRASFDNKCSCYRIGGDEFYSICMDTDKEKLEQELRDMKNNLVKEREDDKSLPTVSYGYSIFQGDQVLDFEKTLKEADDQMYYYKQLQKQKNKLFSKIEIFCLSKTI